jgi:hypothetical protein
MDKGEMGLSGLLDELEGAIVGGLSIPVVPRVLVHRDRCLAMIDRLRASMPEDLLAARRVLWAEETILSEAKAQAAEIQRRAEEQANVMLADNQMVRLAELRSQTIVEEGRRKAERLQQQAENQAYQIYLRLERTLDVLRTQIREAMTIAPVERSEYEVEDVRRNL